MLFIFFFFFNYTATTEIYTYCHTLSLHDALPIFGKGKVAALKNTFAGSKAGFRRVSAGIMANSGDGMGAPLLHADKSWETFGSQDRTAARAGFGIASDYLFLAEGKRIGSFTFRISEGKIHESPAQLNSIYRIDLKIGRAHV